MDGMNKVAMSGFAFLVIGVGLVVALDPWFLGLPFLLIGVQRLVVGLQTKESAE